ncbi:ABC transporter ATP-binding protein [Desulfoferrobacter suflitae]|uniref:ABC transporter ATP-binding protein n=1 Tax=Desulfoferrobacter suflitae TaxID=2865782 RepID=UPI002164CFD2|nr:ABC transporter ATP-binding protein [Desulfoferrobacter suflitae]MCK8600792.1 ABC transporter ATP-binding protein [Desulfoferrobacter suflitae]
MIELSQVSKVFNPGRHNAFTALHGIDLSIKTGGVTVFKGPSGSGKTTLLSVIGCMARPTTGRIFLDGTEITGLPERFATLTRRQTFGFIFQNYNLIRGLTVLENTMIPAYPTGRNYQEIRQRALELLEKLKIESKVPMKVEHLSGGEQQRTAIARALINDPAVVIADEPTAHLDTELSMELLEIVNDLKNEGKTILVASHDPLIFESTAVDRVVSLRDGKMIDQETPR